MKEIELNKIFDSMKVNGISELIIKDGSKMYEIRRGGFKQNTVANVMPVQTMPQMGNINIPVSNDSISTPKTLSSSDNSGTKESSGNGSNLFEIKSPLVGSYYASPKPDAPKFVEVGDKIKKGQTLCIVEAMKNFNEIESEVDGIVREICCKNQELVEFGKVLFRVELQ
jgi:acetyl-CoA carboxylase biotin carboxyl carrier protein